MQAHSKHLHVSTYFFHPNTNRPTTRTRYSVPAVQLAVYAEILIQKRFEHIADIDFSWFNHHKRSVQALALHASLPPIALPSHSHSHSVSCGGTKHNEVRNGVCIHFSRRDPAAPLKGRPASFVLDLVALHAESLDMLPFTLQLTCDARAHTHSHTPPGARLSQPRTY